MIPTVHSDERLSAYMDDELPAAERAAVEAHLVECGHCRERLADLAAVDAAARDLPVPAPPGYFDALPGRVRARLAARRRRSIPAWTWAAAAAVLLAVVTPLTLQQRKAAAPAADRPAASTAGERAAPAQAPGADAPAAPPIGLDQAEQVDGRRTPPAAADKPDALPGRLAARDTAGARPAEPKKREERRQNTLADAPSTADARRDARQEEAFATAVEAPPPPPAAAPATPQEPPRERAEELQLGRAGSARAKAAPASAPAPTPAIASREADEVEAGGKMSIQESVTVRDEMMELVARPQTTAAEARAAARAFREYAQRHRGSDQADEARVRSIEALAAAWRMEHRPADREQARAEAKAYLSGAAPRWARVRAALASLER